MRSRFIRSAIMALCALALSGTAEAQTQSGVSPARLAALAKGVNLSHWFSQRPDKQLYNHKRLEGWITTADFNMLAKAGFTHVRFPIEFEMFFNEQNPSVLNTEYLGDLDHALDAMQSSGLSVIVDFHARKETKQRINEDPAFADKIAQLWTAMAKHMATRDHEHVFFEVMNEPAPAPNSQWWDIQGRLIAAIRAADPDRTIIATGGHAGNLNDLIKHQPYSDKNIIYTFHFYDPAMLTHQGASWRDDPGSKIIGLNYPADEANKEAVARNYPDFRNKIMKFHTNASTLSDHVAEVANWAHSYGVHLYCGEFGVYGKYAPADGRLRWIADVRSILEQNHIDWAMWDYESEFGVAMDDNGHLFDPSGWPDHRQLNPDTLHALGLGR